MNKVRLFWDPRGVTLNSLGSSKLTRITDGDTPFIESTIRMLSIDTPEVHYPGNSNPANHDDGLAQLAAWIEAGKAPISDELAAHLQPKLAIGSAGTLHKQQGDAATEAFQALLDERLARPNGSQRRLFLRTANEAFDQYGRILAYIAPDYSVREREELPYRERATFNLLLVESGMAASFIIFPSLPKYLDLQLMREVAETAITEQRGHWENKHSLTGYEFRMAHRLWKITEKLEAGIHLSSRERYAWISRYCADMTTREIVEPQDYIRIAPQNRIFIWSDQVNEAVSRLNLVPG